MAEHQEKGAKRDAVIVLLDEAGFSEHPLVSATWAPIGQTPVLAQAGSWKKLTVIGALTLQPSGRVNEQFQILRRNATVMDFVNFLLEIRRRYHKPVIVVWDRLRRHTQTQELMKFCDAHWIDFHQLPSYAPDLNPVEGLWSCTKRGALANFAPHNLDELEPVVEAVLQEKKQQQSLLKGLFAGAGLDPTPGRELI